VLFQLDDQEQVLQALHDIFAQDFTARILATAFLKKTLKGFPR